MNYSLHFLIAPAEPGSFFSWRAEKSFGFICIGWLTLAYVAGFDALHSLQEGFNRHTYPKDPEEAATPQDAIMSMISSDDHCLQQLFGMWCTYGASGILERLLKIANALNKHPKWTGEERAPSNQAYLSTVVAHLDHAKAAIDAALQYRDTSGGK